MRSVDSVQSDVSNASQHLGLQERKDRGQGKVSPKNTNETNERVQDRESEKRETKTHPHARVYFDYEKGIAVASIRGPSCSIHSQLQGQFGALRRSANDRHGTNLGVSGFCQRSNDTAVFLLGRWPMEASQNRKRQTGHGISMRNQFCMLFSCCTAESDGKQEAGNPNLDGCLCSCFCKGAACSDPVNQFKGATSQILVTQFA